MKSDIVLLGDKTVLVECGPMRMFIDARVCGKCDPDIEKLAAQKAINFLIQVAQERKNLNLPAIAIKRGPDSDIPRKMWNACRKTMSADLTPMAAVAGSIAEATADYLIGLGATRVIVNNGGDIALRLEEETPVTVGIRSDISSPAIDYKLTVLKSDRVGGVCTSGLGGRSLTRGIASAAVVFASRCSIADAAATEIANHSVIKSPKIKRALARELDPDSDIKDLDVTIGFEGLTDQEIEQALNNGLARANDLIQKELILGVFLKVGAKIGICGEMMSRLEQV